MVRAVVGRLALMLTGLIEIVDTDSDRALIDTLAEAATERARKQRVRRDFFMVISKVEVERSGYPEACCLDDYKPVKATYKLLFIARHLLCYAQCKCQLSALD